MADPWRSRARPRTTPAYGLPDGRLPTCQTMEVNAERELDVLQHIAELGDVRQRDLARIVGVSLGMVNAILRRLSRKGLLTVHKINNRSIAYAVTPEGMEAIAKRSYRYLKRTIKNVVDYRDAIEAIVRTAKHHGFSRLVLVGEPAVCSGRVRRRCGGQRLPSIRRIPTASTGGFARAGGLATKGSRLSVAVSAAVERRVDQVGGF